MRAAIVIAGLVTAPSFAFALEQKQHQSITRDECVAAKLPADFCERTATEAYNVDSYEWSKPEAHSQIPAGGLATACKATNLTLERMRALGTDIRTSVGKLYRSASADLATHIATQLGRSLHTIQDDCAHHGMPNDQHAWASLTDTCTGSQTSPDLAPDALQCARTETAKVFAAFVRELRTAHVLFNELDGISEGWTHWPTRGEVCSFLHGANDWTGVDQRWDDSVVAPWLRDQLTHAITTDSASLGDPCAQGARLQLEQPNDPVDVSKKPKWCFKLKVFCVGKADGADQAPPWEERTAPEVVDVPVATQAAGCQVGGAGSGVMFVVVGLALGRRRVRRGTGSTALGAIRTHNPG